MSRLSMPLLYIMSGEPFIVTLILLMFGKMYFSESLAPAAYGSMNSNRIPFNDRLWEVTLTFILVSVPLLIGITLSRAVNAGRIFCKIPAGCYSACISAWLGPRL